MVRGEMYGSISVSVFSVDSYNNVVVVVVVVVNFVYFNVNFKLFQV
jgi:hypothetical protein